MAGTHHLHHPCFFTFSYRQLSDSISDSPPIYSSPSSLPLHTPTAVSRQGKRKRKNDENTVPALMATELAQCLVRCDLTDNKLEHGKIPCFLRASWCGREEIIAIHGWTDSVYLAGNREGCMIDIWRESCARHDLEENHTC